MYSNANVKCFTVDKEARSSFQRENIDDAKDKGVVEDSYFGSAPAMSIRHLHRGIRRPREYLYLVSRPSVSSCHPFVASFFTRPLYFIVIPRQTKTCHSTRWVRSLFALKYLCYANGRACKIYLFEPNILHVLVYFIVDSHEFYLSMFPRLREGQSLGELFHSVSYHAFSSSLLTQARLYLETNVIQPSKTRRYPRLNWSLCNAILEICLEIGLLYNSIFSDTCPFALKAILFVLNYFFCFFPNSPRKKNVTF